MFMRCIRRWPSAFLASGLIVLAGSPSVAAAQLGGLVKKAAAKVASQGVEMSGVASEPPTFTHELLELTDQRLDAVLAGLAAAERVTASGGATSAQLLQQAAAANQRRDALLARHDGALQRYHEEVARVERCTREAMDSLQREHRAVMERKAQALAASPDPMNTRLIQELMTASAEIQRLAAAGDTAGVVAAQRALARSYGLDPARDSAQATTRCGTPPRRSAWQDEIESLLKDANTLMQQAQALDAEAANTAARTAEMTPRQFAIARERIEAYVEAGGNPRGAWRFSVNERKALYPRIDRFRAQL